MPKPPNSSLIDTPTPPGSPTWQPLRRVRLFQAPKHLPASPLPRPPPHPPPPPPTPTSASLPTPSPSTPPPSCKCKLPKSQALRARPPPLLLSPLRCHLGKPSRTPAAAATTTTTLPPTSPPGTAPLRWMRPCQLPPYPGPRRRPVLAASQAPRHLLVRAASRARRRPPVSRARRRPPVLRALRPRPARRAAVAGVCATT